MNFAKRVFFWAGAYGVLVLLPMFFLEERIGRDFPPASNHPEQYYAFLSVALAWQFVFLLIARDPVRFRPVMLAAIAEKFLPAAAVLWLYAVNRVNAMTLAPFLVDAVLGLLFVVGYFRTAERSPK